MLWSRVSSIEYHDSLILLSLEVLAWVRGFPRSSCVLLIACTRGQFGCPDLPTLTLAGHPHVTALSRQWYMVNRYLPQRQLYAWRIMIRLLMVGSNVSLLSRVVPVLASLTLWIILERPVMISSYARLEGYISLLYNYWSIGSDKLVFALPLFLNLFSTSDLKAVAHTRRGRAWMLWSILLPLSYDLIRIT